MVSTENYSILDKLEDFRRGDGSFLFLLAWPLMQRCKRSSKVEAIAGNKAFDCYNMFSQKSNPALKGKMEGYRGIDVHFTANYWGGLHANGLNCVMDGSHPPKGERGRWFYAVGSSVGYEHGVPAATESEKVVELYAYLVS
jgi:hypothetical protein